MRKISTLLALIGTLVVLDGFRQKAVSNDGLLHLAKYSISSFSKTEQQQIWKTTRQAAEWEAVMTICKRRSYIDSKMTRAISPCVTGQSLRRLQSYFNAKKNRFIEQYQGIDCDNKELLKSIQQTLKQFNDAVKEARSMCDSCLFC